MRFYLSLIIALVLCSFVAAQDESSSYETALARIEAAQDATEIDLSNLFLTELPPEIGNLTNLQILDLIR